MPQDAKQWSVLLAVAVLGALGGFGIAKLPGDAPFGDTKELRDTGEYMFVSPLLSCSETETLLPREVRAAEADVQDILERHEADGTLSTASVYFRDLTNGPWFGINEDARFVPGSLLKVPMMISYLKYLEQHPGAGSTEIVYERRVSSAVQNVGVAHPLVVGERYAADELLRRMIIESDNDSAFLLYGFIGTDLVSEVYSEFALKPPTAGQDYEMRVRDYATFFRILYNATYLTPENSERALTLLTQTDFDKGIAAGVPAGVPVANKFGERNYEGSSEYQLHDCGIVYAPKRPYSLCVMTRGSDIAALSGVIREVSSTVYQHITKEP